MKWIDTFWWSIMLTAIATFGFFVFGMNKFECAIYAFVVSIAYDVHKGR